MTTTHHSDAATVLKPAQAPVRRLWPLAPATALLGGCEGIQSTFSAFGAEAESIRSLTLGMAIAAAVITLGVLWLAWHAVRAPAGRLDHRGGMRVILWFGAIGPTLLLTVLLVLSLPEMVPLSAAAGDLRIAVDGEQFWWRVRYHPTDSEPAETANEIRVPVGRTVVFALASPDVIHSFWIPGLAGKLDMIPGRSNELVVRATKEGIYRGVCAEFCGLSHARMAFDVIAMEPAAFDRWLAELAQPAGGISDADEGRRLFGDYGCDGCHAVRGHFAGSPIGPDLTRMGTRRSLAAGTLPMTQAATSGFIRDPALTKPGALMPSFRDMPPQDADAIAAWLVEHR